MNKSSKYSRDSHSQGIKIMTDYSVTETEWGLECLCRINEQKKLTVLKREGTQQQRPELPIVTLPSVRVNRWYINSTRCYLGWNLCILYYLFACQGGVTIGDSDLYCCVPSLLSAVNSFCLLCLQCNSPKFFPLEADFWAQRTGKLSAVVSPYDEARRTERTRRCQVQWPQHLILMYLQNRMKINQSEKPNWRRKTEVTWNCITNCLWNWAKSDHLSGMFSYRAPFFITSSSAVSKLMQHGYIHTYISVSYTHLTLPTRRTV